MRAENVGKKTTQKIPKKRFLYSHDNRDQKWEGENARNNFSRNTRIVREKYVEEKIVGKNAKTRFLYSHEYRDQKLGGKERAKQFFQKLTNSASKKG